MARVCIVGGHGRVARKVGEILAHEHHVYGLVRTEKHFSDIRSYGEPVLADLEHSSEDSLSAIFDGFDAVVFAAGAGGGSVERTYAVDRDGAILTCRAAQRAKVGKLVVLSTLGPNHPEARADEGDYFVAKREADGFVRGYRTGDWSIVRSGVLSDGPAQNGIVLGRTGDTSSGDHVRRADIAQVLAIVAVKPYASRSVISVFGGEGDIEATLRAV